MMHMSHSAVVLTNRTDASLHDATIMPPVVSDPPTKEQVLRIIHDAEKIGLKTVFGEGQPRFVVYHAPFSVCSEKVRTVLEATGTTYASHAMDIKVKNENYEPAYILLRVVAWLTMDKRLTLAGEEATYEWTGSSSVTANGLDLCVVPTLIDLNPPGSDVPKVIVDSEVIVQYLVRGNEKLYPRKDAALIEKHLRLVDDMPHVAYIYDGNPVKDARPRYMVRLPEGLMHDAQVANLRKFMKDLPNNEDYTDEPLLKRAYQLKLEKTLKGKAKTAEAVGVGSKTDSAYLQAAYDKGLGILNQIEADLEKSGTDWLCGTEEPTLADLMELVSLHRLIWLGMSFMWEDDDENAFPNLTAFVRKGMLMDCLMNAVVSFPGGSPSKGDSPYIREKKGWWPALQNDISVDVNGLNVEILRLTYKPPPKATEALS